MSNQSNPPKNDEGKAATGGGDDAVDLSNDDIVNDPEALRNELASLNDRVLRLAAELENTRRRAERERADAGRYAITGFARDLLSVADTFERALKAAPGEGDQITPEAVEALVTGMKMTDKELLSVLERHGVRRIDPKGDRFDPNLHEAVAQAPGSAPAGHIEEVAQPGFVIGERVLRAAMVIVSTGGGQQAQGPESDGAGSGGDTPPAGSKLDTTV